MQQSQFQQHLPLDESYVPVYNRTDSIAIALDMIERERWSIENLIIDPDYKLWFQERAIIRRVHSSTSIEGNRLNEEETARLLRGEHVDAEDTQKREIVNLKNALDFVNDIAPKTDVPIDEFVIRELHRRILFNEDPSLTPGHYRLGQNRVRNPMKGGIAYIPPNAGDVPSLMHQFGLWLRQEHKPKDAPLVAGIAHLRFVEIHPFWDGNGRTARALEALILERYGYGFNRLLSPERQFVWELRRYFEEIGGTVGEKYQDARDMTSWIEHFLLTLRAEISLVSDQLVDFRRFMESFRSQLHPLGLTKRQIDLLAYTFINRSIQISDYKSIFGKTSQTARRDLKKLIDIGAIRPVGKTRSRKYEYIQEEEFLNMVGG